MNDVTKARYFLRTRQSDLATLETFALMYATAENDYKNIKLKQNSKSVAPGELDAKEIEAALDYAALRYMKKHNVLPPNVADIKKPNLSLEEKRSLAAQWFNG